MDTEQGPKAPSSGLLSFSADSVLTWLGLGLGPGLDTKPQKRGSPKLNVIFVLFHIILFLPDITHDNCTGLLAGDAVLLWQYLVRGYSL